MVLLISGQHMIATDSEGIPSERPQQPGAAQKVPMFKFVENEVHYEKYKTKGHRRQQTLVAKPVAATKGRPPLHPAAIPRPASRSGSEERPWGSMMTMPQPRWDLQH